MNAENILNALNDISDRRILDTEAPIRPRRAVRSLAVIAAVLALCIALTIPAAAYTDAGYTILYDISPAVAQALKPVNESCEANGIRMTVDSAVIENNTAYIRIAMTDLEGDLFDKSIDLDDSYEIRRSFDAAGTCSKEGYDEATHTATFLIQLSPMASVVTGRDGALSSETTPTLSGGKTTFSVGHICGFNSIWEKPVEGVDLAAAQGAPETFAKEQYEYDRETDKTYLVSYDCLTPGVPVEICPGAAITGIGWVDGKLHVQVRLDGGASGVVYLTDSPGVPMDESDPVWESARPMFFGQDLGEDDGHRYDEYIFDVTPAEAEALTLQGWFYIMSEPVEGPWEVTFRLE